MTVRRLAAAEVQPAAFAFNAAMSAEAKTWIKKYPEGREQSAVIPLLMLAQEQEGWVTKAAIEHVAEMLDMPLIRVLEVATFYTQFQLQPVGTRAHVQVCGTTPCMLRGAGDLIEVCRSKIHPEQFHTNDTGTLSWEEVECQGACVNAPMVMIFKDAYEDLTPERLAEIIDLFEAGKGGSVIPGPQVDRVYSAPRSGLTSLLDENAVLKSTRDRKAALAAASADEGTSLPPSRAAKPKTHAAETNNAVKSPSPVKSGTKAEKSTSASAPVVDTLAANKAEPAVEAVSKQRKGAAAKSEPVSAYKAPERLKGEPVGAASKKIEPAKPSLTDKNRPAGIERPETIDDLKLISGIGPKNEAILHSLGIFTFAQVASWKKAEREWVDNYLNFKGRIEREDWNKQAKVLAKGGVAEYIRVFGKKPV
ncbi:NADH-quinone oxidoreductase subunit E [Pseudaminobacter sp. NGMCC 1.201702]|uniref:NADH-quinone oxidoreductase subunit E n=1 Tax=Pseudaminobacter sp. NGMCC 1.201702 TaxID=3391825 RepID=UPI0039F0DB90